MEEATEARAECQQAGLQNGHASLTVKAKPPNSLGAPRGKEKERGVNEDSEIRSSDWRRMKGCEEAEKRKWGCWLLEVFQKTSKSSGPRASDQGQEEDYVTGRC